MGGDFTSLSTNPGGIGVYRSSNVSAGIEVFSRKVNSTYNGNETEDSKTMFDMSNFGYIMSKAIGRGGRGWKYWQFGVGMNRLNNYNSNIFIQGINQQNSRMDVYLEETFTMLDNGYGLDEIDYYDPFYLGPAWETYLMDTVAFEGDLYLVSPVPPGGIMQSQQIFTSGSNNEYLISAGANFDDLLYVGLTLGLPYLSFNSETIYYETDVADTIPTFNEWSVTENLRTTGWGVNAKLGVIIRPLDFIRIGLAYHTPTYYYNMRDRWNTFTQSSVMSLSTGEWVEGQSLSPDGEYKYKLTTPMRFIGSLAFTVSDYGFISAEYEYVNYTQAKFKAKDYGFDVENEGIDNYFKSTGIFRVGTEWRLASLLLRAGYNMYWSPYATDPQTGEPYNDGVRKSISGGIGYRTGAFSLDFAYVHSVTNENYYLYSTELVQTNPVANKIIDQNFVLTFRYFLSK